MEVSCRIISVGGSDVENYSGRISLIDLTWHRELNEPSSTTAGSDVERAARGQDMSEGQQDQLISGVARSTSSMIVDMRYERSTVKNTLETLWCGIERYIWDIFGQAWRAFVLFRGECLGGVVAGVRRMDRL